MLSREDRILSELIVSRGLVAPEAVERGARQLEESDERGLASVLVCRGELDAETARRVSDEAREIDGLLRPELPEGRMLGEFRLLRELGRGGMGIVYEAEQVPLGRRVALKVLPSGAALDERLAIRFVREARIAARLRHPGLVPVFGTGREQGVLFFAMELVEGESLADRIGRGPVPARAAARIVSDVAHALEHAHRAGLVHRDVKPDNVMIGRDGRARLADFGLAHDLHASRLTRSHFVLGTPAYSAPEQARGSPVDRRSDVYGAGAVLYTTLAGAPPYAGEVPAAVLGRVLHGTPPPLARVAPGIPPRLAAICARAMAREPADRFPTAGALAEALDRYLDEEPSGPAKPAGSHRVAVAVALVATVAAVTAAVFVRLTGAQLFLPRALDAGATGEPPAARAGLLEGSYGPWPGAPGPKGHIALSPDGRTLAYSSGSTSFEGRLWIQRVDEPAPRRLLPFEDTQGQPTWSPDGTRIAYCRSTRLEVLNLASGSIDTLDADCAGKMSWAPGGDRIVVAQRSWPLTRLRVVDLRSGRSHWISRSASYQPSWSPQGRIAYVAQRNGRFDVWTCREDGSDARQVTDDAARDGHPVWSSIPGRLYYGRSSDDVSDLWRVDLDPRTGGVLAPPVPVSRGWLGSWVELASARQRERLALVHEVPMDQIWSLPLDTRGLPAGPAGRERLALAFDAYLPRRAPDRNAWVAANRGGDDAENLHVISDGETRRITAGPFRDAAPRWSPDGSTIAFHSDRSGTSQIWTVNADGTGLRQVTGGSNAARYPVWSPDGRRLACFVEGEGPQTVDLHDGSSRPLEVAGLAGFEPWSWSPDGRRIAGTAAGVVVVDVGRRTAVRVSQSGARPSWVAGGDVLLFADGDDIVRWDGREPRRIASVEPGRLVSDLGVPAGGRELYYRAAAAVDRVWWIDLGRPRLTE